MIMAPHFLQRLELDDTADERTIRRAYARELKKIDQEADPAGFQALRTAYEAALAWAQQPRRPVPVPEAAVPDAAPPATDTTPSYAPPKIVPRLRTEAVPPVVPPEKDDTMAHASTAFDRFMESFGAAVSRASSTRDAKMWQANLEQCLASDELISMTARDIFEHKFALLLSQGWKPGHEVLFVVAAKVFRWDENRRHLQGLGYVGFMLERALQERAMFDRQHPNERMPQRALIQRLRDPAEPNHEELDSSFTLLENLARNFPTWLGIITNMGQLPRWRELHSAMPPKMRRAPEIVGPLPSPKAPTVSPKLWWGILLALIALVNSMHTFDSKPVPPPSSHNEQDAIRRKIQATLEPPPMQEMLGLPNNRVPVDPRGGRPVPPPLSEKTVAALVKKVPNEQVCNEVAKIAYDYGVGTAQQDADPGAAFDRQVIACVGRKHWPRSIANDPALQLALDREKKRLAINMKAIQAELGKMQLTTPSPRPQLLAVPPMPVDITQPAIPAASKRETVEQDNR
jgi:protein TonB